MSQAHWERRIRESRRHATGCLLALLISLVLLSAPAPAAFADPAAAATTSTAQPSGLFWVGLAYLAEDRGAGALIGTVGVMQSSVNAAIIGAVFGGPAGFAAGVGYGL